MEIKKFIDLVDSAIFVIPNFTKADYKKDPAGLLRLYSDCQRAHGRYVKVGGRALHIATNARHRSPERSVKSLYEEPVLFSHNLTELTPSGLPKSPKGRGPGKRRDWEDVLAKLLDLNQPESSFADLRHSLSSMPKEVLQTEITTLARLGYVHLLGDSIMLTGSGAERAFKLGYSTRSQRLRGPKVRS